MLEFYCDCVAWDRKDVPALCDLVDDAIDITRRTFLKHVSDIDLHYIEDLLGYARHWKHGMTMPGDYHVSYHRGKLHGEWAYFFKHSGIEYVFQ